MKLTKLVVYALITCMSLVSHAEAKGRSFRGGFSSQVRSAKPAPAYYKAPAYQAPVNTQNRNTAFGSFSGSKTKTEQSANYQPSQMSKDLNSNAAQTNALKTFDARNANNQTNAQTSGSGGNGWFRSGGGYSGDKNGGDKYSAPQQPLYTQPVIHQTVHQSGGFMHGLMWFMIGRSTVPQTNTVYVPTNNQPQVTDGNSWTANGVAPQLAPVEEKESFFMKFVRVLLWVGFIAGFIWLVRKVLGFANGKSTRANYSLRS